MAPTPLFTPPPVTSPATPGATGTPRPTPAPTPPPWPVGWNEDFCAAFSELAIAQELTVDIPRAMDEDENDDALALARELRATAIAATELLEDVAEWEPGQPAVDEMVTLADIGSRVGRQYVRFLDEGRRPALRRVDDLYEDMRPVVDDANAALAELDAMGLACPPRTLDLEAP